MTRYVEHDLTVEIPGIPMAWKRAGRNMKRGIIYVDSAVQEAKGVVAMSVKKAVMDAHLDVVLPLQDGPVEMTMVFMCQASKMMGLRKAKRIEMLDVIRKLDEAEIYDWQRLEEPAIMKTTVPDCDNFAKLVLDACNGILYRDDRQVSGFSVKKRLSNRPRTIIVVKIFEKIAERR